MHTNNCVLVLHLYSLFSLLIAIYCIYIIIIFIIIGELNVIMLEKKNLLMAGIEIPDNNLNETMTLYENEANCSSSFYENAENTSTKSNNYWSDES